MTQPEQGAVNDLVMRVFSYLGRSESNPPSEEEFRQALATSTSHETERLLLSAYKAMLGGRG